MRNESGRIVKLDTVIKGVSRVEFQNYPAEKGNLLAFEFHQLPFLPSRVFSVFGVEPGGIRGNHAHRACRQLLVVTSGTVVVDVWNGFESHSISLESPGQGVFMESMIWASQTYLDAQSSIIVFASHPYSLDDYVDSKEQYVSMVS